MNINVEISCEKDVWRTRKVINKKIFTDILKNILNRHKCFNSVDKFELSVLLTDDSKMKSLNSEFRSIDKSTNVLSFQDLEINWQDLLEFKPQSDYLYLGDIAFSYETILAESLSGRISFENHFKHLLIHAVLHLIGYDHVLEGDATIMENLEVEILSDYNIKSPY